MTIAIRELGIGDKMMLEELLDAVTPGWSDDLAPGGSGPMAFLAQPRSFVFGAYVDNDASGWLWGAQTFRPDGQLLSVIHEVTVTSENRRRGIGRSLIEAAIGLAGRRGSRALQGLISADDPAAIGLCLAAGGSPNSDGGELLFTWPMP